MIKKIVQTAIIGGSLLGLIGSANAAKIEVNLYGASAQYEFWTAAAPGFLTYMGCNPSDIYTAKDNGNKHGIAMCAGSEVPENGTGFNNDNNTYYLRYSSKASYDGIRSVQGLDPDSVSGTCLDNERMMADESTTNWGTTVVGSLTCKDVTIGASDVAAETFQQESHGLKYGPWVDSTNTYENKAIYNITMDPNYNIFRPIVVPFAFFRNANTSTPVPYDNMSRLMATSIFSGNVTDWNQFDPTKTSLPIIVCMRHAGSGTHATLDAAVMRGDYTLMINEALPGSFEVMFGLVPETYFNDGSSDEMRCIGGAGSRTGYTTYTGVGAVGYADADKVIMSDGTPLAPNNIPGEYHDVAGYGDLKLMTWQGEAATKSNIVNGKYDFWSAQWLYAAPADSGTGSLVEALSNYASIPANMPPAKATYWAAQGEMKVEKATDFTYPKFK